MRFEKEGEEDASVRGKPINTARAAAREKFRTEVMETTAEAKQRLNALRTVARGAEGGAGGGTSWRASAGNAENSRKTAVAFTYAGWSVNCLHVERDATYQSAADDIEEDNT